MYSWTMLVKYEIHRNFRALNFSSVCLYIKCSNPYAKKNNLPLSFSVSAPQCQMNNASASVKALSALTHNAQDAVLRFVGSSSLRRTNLKTCFSSLCNGCFYGWVSSYYTTIEDKDLDSLSVLHQTKLVTGAVIVILIDKK